MRISAIILCLIPILNFGQNFDLEYIGVREGLPQSTVTALFQDSRKLIWIGTRGGGLASYDGRNMEVYDEQSGFENKLVNWITESHDHNLYIGSSWGGLTIYNGSKFETIGYSDSSVYHDGHLTSFCWKGDTIILGTHEGLYYYIPGNKLKPYHIPGLRNYEISDIERDLETGLLYISTEDLIFVSDGNRLTDTIDLDGAHVMDMMVVNKESQLIIGTDQGAYGYFKEKLIFFGWRDETINCIGEGEKGDIWIGSEKVRIMFDGVHSELSESNGLLRSGVRAIIEDHTGNMWIGTDGNGLILFKRNGFRYYEGIDGFGSPDIFSVTGFESKLWGVSLSKGLYSTDKYGKITHYPRSLFDNGRILCLYPTGTDMLIGCSTGIYCIRWGVIRKLNRAFFGNGPAPQIRAIIQTSKDQIIFGTATKGILLFENGRTKAINPLVSADGLTVHSLLEDSKGRVWVGSGIGVYCIEGDSVIHYDHPTICNNYIGSLLEDKFGRIWMGTDRCVEIFENGSFTSLDYDNQLNSNTIYLLNTDTAGNLFVGTNKGLNKIMLNDDGSILSVLHLAQSEGFKGVECNSRSTYRDSTGNLYFGTIHGLIKLDYRYRKSTPQPPLLYLKSIEVYFRKRDWSKYGKTNWFGVPVETVLPAEENHVSFVLGAIDLNSGDNIKYRFKLEGFDEQWSPLTSYDKAVYANLPSGTYYFKAKAKNASGYYSDELIYGPVVIEKAPPPPPQYYETWWFYTLIGLPVIMLLYYLIVIRNRQLNISKKQLEFQVSLRTKEIKKQNDEKEVMLKEIHHRVKNNLQIINSLLNLQSHTVSDNTALRAFEECKNRISSMALIHERMYETQNLANIRFRDYAHDITRNLISSYAVGKEIKLDIEMDDTVFKIDYLVPLGLILNEVITNALKYAFENTENGSIYIHTHVDRSGMFVLSIGDNGSGLPDNFDIQSSETLGMQLIVLLTEQLDGTVLLLPGNGTRFEIRFKP